MRPASQSWCSHFRMSSVMDATRRAHAVMRLDAAGSLNLLLTVAAPGGITLTGEDTGNSAGTGVVLHVLDPLKRCRTDCCARRVARPSRGTGSWRRRRHRRGSHRRPALRCRPRRRLPTPLTLPPRTALNASRSAAGYGISSQHRPFSASMLELGASPSTICRCAT